MVVLLLELWLLLDCDNKNLAIGIDVQGGSGESARGVKDLVEVDLINTAEYEKSDLFSVKLELRGSNIEHQRHLSTNCSIITDQLLLNHEPSNIRSLKVTMDNSINTGIMSKNGGIQPMGSDNGPSPLKKRTNFNEKHRIKGKKISPKHHRRKKPVKEQGTPELHRYFHLMKEKRKKKNDAEKKTDFDEV